jgi:hypothetical protein
MKQKQLFLQHMREGKLTAINKAAETLPCKLPFSGDSSADVVELPGDVTF